eukprot:Em0622g3a
MGFKNATSSAYTNPYVVDTELGKEITAGWIINDHINIMKAKIDLKAAFHLIPVRAVDWVHLGMDRTCLPFGLRSSLSLINNYADALHWIMASYYGAQLLPYLDDFLLVGPPGKDTSGTADGLTKSWLSKHKATKRELLSLIGKLSFAKVAPAVRLFLCHLIDLSTTVRKLHHHISLNALASDVMWWESFLHLGNGVAIIVEPDKTEADSLQLFTDASGSLGFGTYFNGGVHSTNINSTPLARDLNYHLQLLLAKAVAPSTRTTPLAHTTANDTGNAGPDAEEAGESLPEVTQLPHAQGSPHPCLLQFPVGMGCHSQPMFFPSTFLHLIEQCGFDAAKFNTHSLRIGAASTAARAGLPSDTIQKLNKASQLYVASEKGDYEGVKRLLGAGAKVNEAISDDGCSPLYAASCNGHLDVVKTLLEAGANINQVNKNNTTPLYMASEKGHHDVVQTLLGAGADVNIATSDVGRRPLYIASCNGHLGVVKTLMEAGANISETNKLAMTGNRRPWKSDSTCTFRIPQACQSLNMITCPTLHPESEDSSESSSEGATTESTPYIFNQFASALHWIMATNYAADLIHYLDDFLLAGLPGQPTCSESTETMLRVCERLGIPVALDKLEGPATTITFLGITIDNHTPTAAVPPDKLQK